VPRRIREQSTNWRYGIYGVVIDSTNGAPFVLRYRWTGREYDAETGWYYFRARYYDPAAMRFVQEDPAGYAGGSNVYAYGDGNPTDGRDPSGLAKDAAYYTDPNPPCIPCSDRPAMYLDGAPLGGMGGMAGWVMDALMRIGERMDRHEYRLYLDAYAIARASTIAELRAVRDLKRLAMAALTEAFGRPLRFEEFLYVRSLISNLAGCPKCGSDQAAILSSMLTSGQIGINDFLSDYGSNIRLNDNWFMQINSTRFGHSLYEDLNTLDHEAWHVLAPWLDEDQTWAVACRDVWAKSCSDYGLHP
jgi:RHS repeat-associated protein